MPQTLEEYHAKIERMMAEGDALVAARDPASEDAAKRRMSESALVMASYQLFVHRQVFAPMLEHADAATRARVNELKVDYAWSSSHPSGVPSPSRKRASVRFCGGSMSVP